MGRKISPEIQHVAEKYLASLGSSRWQLTYEQWRVVTRHIKYRRVRGLWMFICLCLAVLLLWSGFRTYRHAHGFLSEVLPVKSVRIYQGDRETLVEPQVQEIQNYINLSLKYGAKIGYYCLMGLFFLIIPFDHWLWTKRMDKVLEAFILRKQEQGAARLENQMSSE